MAELSYDENMTILDAIDHLSTLVDIDIQEIVKSGEGAADKLKASIVWLDLKDVKHTEKVIKDTYAIVYNYMRYIYEKGGRALQDVEMQKGVKAIMGLARAAATKVDDLYSAVKIKGKASKIIDLKEYITLENFYQKEVIEKFKASVEEGDEWIKELESMGVEGAYAHKIKDLKEVKDDHNYELFYIKKESGQPFFGSKLLQNLKLVTDFDEMMTEIVGDDPLIYVKVVQDEEACQAANEILLEIKDNLTRFLSIAKEHPKDSFIGATYKAILALMAASNRENLLLTKRRKSTLGYFHDFHYYLRSLLTHEDYLRFYYDKMEAHGYEKEVINLIHQMCGSFFLHDADEVRSVSFIKELIKRGQIKEKARAQFSIWTWILDCSDHMQNLLKHYPNGPLLKVLDAFKDREYEEGFDPLSEDNMPHKLFHFQIDELNCITLRLPSPTVQKVINHAEIAEEFKGLMRYLAKEKKGQKFLLFNLQDRTTWKEHARADSLEILQKEEEMKELLYVVTLAKDTPFYFQSAEYATINESDAFKSVLLQQIKGGKSCGFYIPVEIDHKKIFEFASAAIEEIHTHFFSAKNVLTRKNRLDFIEIFYLFLELKILLMIQPEYISFSCKDAVDVGSSASFSFFCFLKLFQTKLQWSEEEKDILLRIVFAPALLVRERNVDMMRLSRSVSILALINSERDVHRNSLIGIAHRLFGKDALNHIELF